MFQIVEVLSGGELMSVARELDFLPGFAFEGFPNRDSTMYSSLYGIEDATTMFRGTLRYKGNYLIHRFNHYIVYSEILCPCVCLNN